jgi:tryptophanyl-tRNA synthetase
MSLSDGGSKMSKSDPNEGSRIHLLDPPEVIQRKVKRAKTDPVMGLSFDPGRPEAANLLGLYAVLSGRGREAAALECADMGWGRFKPLLTETLVESVRPIQERYAAISADPGGIEAVLGRGRERAEAVASATLARLQGALGFLPRRH